MAKKMGEREAWVRWFLYSYFYFVEANRSSFFTSEGTDLSILGIKLTFLEGGRGFVIGLLEVMVCVKVLLLASFVHVCASINLMPVAVWSGNMVRGRYCYQLLTIHLV